MKIYNALQDAIRDNNDKMVKFLLLSRGKGPHSKTDDSELVRLAIDGDHWSCVKLLLKAGVFINVEGVISYRRTLLECILFSRDTELVRLVLERGADVNYRSMIDRDCALHQAIYLKFEKAVPLLLKAGASPDVLNCSRMTPLMKASRFGLTVAIKSLINGGANINATTHLGITSLMLSIVEKKIKATALLLKAGADVNQVGASGSSPLMFAIGHSNEAAAKLLLHHPGIDINIADEDGKTPLSVAKQWQRQNFIDLLEEYIDNNKEGACDRSDDLRTLSC